MSLLIIVGICLLGIGILILYKKESKSRNILLVSLIFIAGILVGIGSMTISTQNSKNFAELNDSTLIQNAKMEVAFEDSVYNYIVFLNIKHPEVVFKQAKIESGNFKSKVFKENNNMFGMRVPFKRANIAEGENRGYAVYSTWQESIIDYALYQTYSAKGMNKEEYINFLGSGSYAEDPDYKQKLK